MGEKGGGEGEGLNVRKCKRGEGGGGQKSLKMCKIIFERPLIYNVYCSKRFIDGTLRIASFKDAGQ